VAFPWEASVRSKATMRANDGAQRLKGARDRIRPTVFVSIPVPLRSLANLSNYQNIQVRHGQSWSCFYCQGEQFFIHVSN